jgi:hypothetical protein
LCTVTMMSFCHEPKLPLSPSLLIFMAIMRTSTFTWARGWWSPVRQFIIETKPNRAKKLTRVKFIEIIRSWSVLFEMDRNYLKWIRIIWNGSVLVEMDCYYLKWTGISWNGSLLFEMDRYYLTWIGIIWNGSKLFDMDQNYLKPIGIIWNVSKLVEIDKIDGKCGHRRITKIFSLCQFKLFQRVSFASAVRTHCCPGPVLPDFSWYNLPKRRKIYQITTKYIKWLHNIPTGCQIYQRAIKYTSIFYFQCTQMYPNWDFWYANTYMYHLATLVQTVSVLIQQLERFVCILNVN